MIQDYLPPLPSEPSPTAQLTLRLTQWFDNCPGAAVAFSGGVDSALVAFWARRVLGKSKASAWIATSASLSRQDLDIARRFCATHDIVLHELATQEVADPAYSRNGFDRCFHCKTILYADILKSLEARQPGAWICNGTNADDPADHRPGLRAAELARVRSPLLECRAGKGVIRDLSREHGLEVWNKPASPCLSSRIPYGQAVTATKLARIESAEEWLHKLGFLECRVRHLENSARLEVPSCQIPRLESMRPEIEAAFLAMGFSSIEIDAEGLVSGKLNRMIWSSRRVAE